MTIKADERVFKNQRTWWFETSPQYVNARAEIPALPRVQQPITECQRALATGYPHFPPLTEADINAGRQRRSVRWRQLPGRVSGLNRYDAACTVCGWEQEYLLEPTATEGSV